MRKRKPIPTSGTWVSTAIAAKSLGISTKYLTQTLRVSLIKGKHWVYISPKGAIRPTYRWNVPEIMATLSD